MNIEKHFTTTELADIMKLSRDKVQRLFRNEPGVFVTSGEKKKWKRTRQTIRIPESVFERVYRRMTNPAN